MTIEMTSFSSSPNVAPQTDYHANRAAPPVSRGDPSAVQDTVDLSTQQVGREVQFVVNPETKKVVAKVVDQKTHQAVGQVPDVGVQQLSASLGRYMGKTFSLAV